MSYVALFGGDRVVHYSVFITHERVFIAGSIMAGRISHSNIIGNVTPLSYSVEFVV